MTASDSREELRRTFPVPRPQDWRAEAERLLRGASFDEKMITHLPEGLDLDALYTRAGTTGDGKEDPVPGQAPFVRGDRPRQPAWWVAQEQPIGDDPAVDNARLRNELEQGLDAVVILFDDPSRVEMARLLQGIPLESTPLLLHGGFWSTALRAQLEALARSDGVELARLRGAVAADPLGQVAIQGSDRGVDDAFDELAETTQWCAERAVGLRSLWVRGEIFHEAGAHAVQELGFSLAAMVESLRELQARGLAAERVAARWMLSLGVGGRTFLELAKLRAMRLLVARVLESCGVPAESRRVFLHARCASRNKSRIDEHVNLLRSTTEAFSAAAGGADSIHVEPFDEPSLGGSPLARRLARNLQLILREEAQLGRVVDPAGGSWYVERLSADLAAAGWESFRGIESEGGFLASLRAGSLQEQLHAARAAQQTRMAERREIRVGSNRYPPLGRVFSGSPDASGKGETIQAGRNAEDVDPAEEPSASSARSTFEPLPRYRECRPFEALREAVERTARREDALKVFVVTLGEIRRYMPRLDFTASFFELGGFLVERGTGTLELEAAAAAARESGAGILVVCGRDESYVEKGVELARALRRECPDAALLFSGPPEEGLRAELSSAGVEHFLHAHSDVLELLNGLARRGGVS